MATIRKHGAGWEARVRRKGHPHISKHFPRKDQAVRWAQQVEAEMERGPYASLSRPVLSVHQALTRYAEEVSSKKKGARQEISRIKRLQAEPFSALDITELRGFDLARFRDCLLQAGLAANTVRLHLALLSHMYNVARKEWGYERLSNPCDDISKPKQGAPRERRFEGDELQRILDDTDSAILKTILQLAIETGMRRGELCVLHWQDYKPAIPALKIQMSKNGSSRVVPLSPRAVELLEALPRSGELIFDVEPDSITRAFRRACDRLGIENLRFHDTRHEATSQLFEDGLEVMEVASITGHKTLSMLMRYTHLRAGTLASKLARARPR
ncbi:tyrosine-type recombinase/integrase [Craterilacuibacter sp.]|uniref:tyrosine-type recombinase/integrase n=1 Tax=Craterilacuibacter sp. TaxID=2870909 RepID=UPI003F2A582A